MRPIILSLVLCAQLTCLTTFSTAQSRPQPEKCLAQNCLIKDGIGIENIVVGQSVMKDVVARFGSDYKLTAHAKYSYEARYEKLGLSFYYYYNDEQKKIFHINISLPFKGVTGNGIVLGQSTLEEVEGKYWPQNFTMTSVSKTWWLDYPGIQFHIEVENPVKQAPAGLEKKDNYRQRKVTQISVDIIDPLPPPVELQTMPVAVSNGPLLFFNNSISGESKYSHYVVDPEISLTPKMFLTVKDKDYEPSHRFNQDEFLMGRGGHSELFFINTKTGVARRLLEGGLDKLFKVDGDKVFFIEQEHGERGFALNAESIKAQRPQSRHTRYRLYVFDRTTAAPSKLVTREALLHVLAIDEKYCWVVLDRAQPELWRIAKDGHEEKKIAEIEDGWMYSLKDAVVSPDGNLLTNLAARFESLGLSVTVFRTTPIRKLIEHYGISAEEASWVKQCINRHPIDEKVVQTLLENSNFLCCSCKGIKADSYIIHHIIEYETSQDNSYDNLAVLCLNDHDLAHRPPGLTNKLTSNQIRRSKASWENQVRLHNLAVSRHGESEQYILRLPRYQELRAEISILNKRLADKEKLLARSEAFFDVEISKLQNQITELEAQKIFLEQQVTNTAQKLSSIDLSIASELYSEAVSLFLDADLSGAIAALSDDELDTELANFEEIEDELNESIRKNADSRILKAQLLTLDLKFTEAQQNAGRGLQLYEDVADRNPERYMLGLASCFEDVGTIYYNTGLYDAAEACFHNGLGVCQELQELGIYAQLPLVALLLQNIGACHYSRGEYEVAKEYLEESNTLFAGIQSVYSEFEGADLSSFEHKRAMAITNLGTTYRALDMHDSATKLFLQGCEIYEDLVAKDEDKHLPGLVKNLSSLSKHYLTLNDLDAAKENYLRVLPIIRKLVEKDRSRYLEELADILLDICSIYLRTEVLDEAKKFCDEALILYQEFASIVGERAEVKMAAALLYHSILLKQKEGGLIEIIRVAQEAKIICEKYAYNPEAKKLCEAAERLLEAVE